ncbi:hypothetical protein C2E23DRAFT_499256 [Lenzites betulinus]|nr:hypothetical protein C2E23DRAFT_499256 [Lenzites betulinus]
MVTSVGRSIHALSDHVLGALMRMCNLRTLWVRAALLDQPTFAHLGSLSTLTGLALEAGWSNIAYPDRTETGSRAFAALRELSVSIAHSDAPHFLAHIDPESLEAVNIHWEYLYSDASSSGAVLQQLFAALSQLPKISLKHVSVALDAEMEQMVHIADGGPDDSHSHRLKGLADCSFDLEPVLSLTALRTLEIGIDVVFQVDDEFLMALAENMPHLESLRLTPLLRGPFSFDCLEPVPDELNSDILGIPNLDGLFAFSKRCLKLTTLRLAVRASLSGDSRSRLELDAIPSSCGVRTLELWTTALDPEVSDETFVSFLVGAFPSLEELCAVLPISHPEHEMIPRTEARARWERVANDVSAHERSAARVRSHVLWEIV